MKIELSNFNMRTIHRYLGYFLAGIMLVYSLSGILLIYRDTDVFKVDMMNEKEVGPGLSVTELGVALKKKNLEIIKTEGDIMYFDTGTFNSKTGIAKYTTKQLPYALKKLTDLHKADTEKPLYWLNIFFGVSLAFFVISAFWMYRPKTSVFRNGVIVALIGITLALLLIYW